MERDAKADLELCNEATKGPWDTDRYLVYSPDGTPIFGLCNSIDEGRVESRFTCGIQSKAEDIDFIAASREALPYWIQRASDLHKEVMRLQEELDEVKKEFQDYRRDY